LLLIDKAKLGEGEGAKLGEEEGAKLGEGENEILLCKLVFYN
jgi:hypothetical protein